jgi:hypothetical protein
MNFKEYMNKYIKEESPRGDFARDIVRDHRLDDKNNDLVIFKMLDYIKSMNMCYEAIKVYDRYKKKYLKENEKDNE